MITVVRSHGLLGIAMWQRLSYGRMLARLERAIQEVSMIRMTTLTLLLLPLAVHAECASEDRIDMALAGLTQEQIDAQCGSDQNYYAPPQDIPAAYCVTQFGSCPMPYAVPRGASCSCDSPGGPIPGVTN
jgi:hypothetical protein